MFPLIGIFWSFVERESATAWLLVEKEDYMILKALSSLVR